MPETRTAVRPRPQQEERIVDVLSANALSIEMYDELLYLREHPEEAMYPKWNIGVLDRLTNGIGPWYITLVAKQKFGKSFLLQHMEKQINLYGKRTLKISLEMDEFMVACRLFANEAEVNLSKFSQPHTMSDEEWKRVSEARDRIRAFNQFFNFDARRIVDIQRVIDVLDPDYVFIDYADLMTPENTRQNRSEQIAEISRALKAMTRMQQGEEDQRMLAYRQMTAEIQSFSEELGSDATQEILGIAQTMWDQYQMRVKEGIVQPRIRRRRGIVTPSQTSKAQQQEDRLGETAPKGSQALFEDCDFGMTGNLIRDEHTDKEIPNVRLITVAVSRVSAMGDEFKIGINPSLAEVWDYEKYGEKGPKNSIIGRF